MALYSQKIAPEQLVQLDSIQKSLQEPAWLVLYGEDEDIKTQANYELTAGLKVALELPGSFYFPFDSLSSIARLTSQDGKVKIFTWNLPTSEGAYRYYGFIQRQDEKGNSIHLFELQDEPDQGDSIEKSGWFGALYYQIIDVKKGRNRYYTLLGWKGNSPITTKKVIEVLSFDKNGQPVFGANIFVMKDRTEHDRMIYEFSAEVSMSISYDESHQTIIMDHLFPSNPSLEGHYEFYGPDLSFDAFKLKKGKWEHVEDYDPGIRPPEKEKKLKEEKPIYGRDD